jgi:L-lactate permease
MNAEPTTTESKEPEQGTGAPGIIFAVVGAACGVFTATKLASVLPVWAAVLLTIVLWLVLVVCMTASCGSELLDVLVGSVTIIVVMTLVVPAFIRKRHREDQRKPTAAHSYVEPARVIQPTIALHSTPGARPVSVLGVIGPARVSAGRYGCREHPGVGAV